MDPKACLDLMESSLDDGDLDQAFDSMRDYFNWRRNGGFAPDGGDDRWKKLSGRLAGEAV